MNKKRITQIFPFLLPLRKAQRKFCFYLKMLFDGNHYAGTKAEEPLPYCLYETKTLLLNPKTGFDMKYQRNKVFNLKLASQPVNNIVIRPHETFSFWQLVRIAGSEKKYEQGLSIENGELVTVPRGGLCQLSNLLFWMFLHTPLSIIERHPHQKQDFPSPDDSVPDGVDATVSEGWLDLKMENNTALTYQIILEFDGAYLYGKILTDRSTPYRYRVVNRNKCYFMKDDKHYESVSVFRQKYNVRTSREESECLLYTDEFELGYVPETEALKESI